MHPLHKRFRLKTLTQIILVLHYLLHKVNIIKDNTILTIENSNYGKFHIHKPFEYNPLYNI